MKNKILLILLLGLTQKVIFTTEGAAAAALPCRPVPSLKQICVNNIINTLDQYEDSDPIKMDICESMLTKKLPEKLINEIEDSKKIEEFITSTAAKLWVQHPTRLLNDSPFRLLELYNPKLADFVTKKGVPWKLSLQDLLDAGGSEILQNTNEFFASYLSLTSLEGLKKSSRLKLTRIELNANKLPTLNKDIFNGFPSLKFLHLRYNKIIIIDPNAFNGLPALTALSLDGNQITTIEPDTFTRLTALKYLNLSENPIPLAQRDMIRAQVPAGCVVMFD
ncbi:leucine-rich repeat domain-containing protein [Candidatus Babeliales bacterium]|nr:leucine-rich repeat domain-containing protein [Candidatus Babeliales bacterium]